MAGQDQTPRRVQDTLTNLRIRDGAIGADGTAPPPSGPLTLEDLYRQHRMRLVRLALLLVDEPATAEDVVQEAFTGLHRNWSGLRDAQAAVGYLRTAVVNGSRSVLRRRKTARDYTPPHVVNARSAESLAMLTAEHQAVVAALSAAAAAPARGAGAALLRRPDRGRDRRGDRHLEGHREVHRQPRAGRAAEDHGRSLSGERSK